MARVTILVSFLSSDMTRRRLTSFSSPRVAREGLWLLGGHLTVAVAGLVGLRLLTELAPAEIFGEANLLLGLLGLGIAVFVAPVTATQVKYHSEYLESGVGQWYFARITRLVLFGAALFVCVGGTSFVLWRHIEGTDMRFVLLIALGCLLIVTVVRNVFVNRLNAERLQASYAKWLGGESILVIGITALGLFLVTGVEGYVIGQLTGTVLALALFGLLMYPAMPEDKRAATRHEQFALRRQIIQYGLPFSGLALLSWVANLADRYVLAGLEDIAAAGLYIAAFTIGSRVMIIVNTVFGDALRPVLFDALRRQDRLRARSALTVWICLVLVCGAVIAAGMLLLGDLLAALLLAESYRSTATAVMVWVAGAYTIYGAIQAIENYILGCGISRRLVMPQAFGAIANVLFAFILISKYGVIGAAQANAASFGVQLLFTAWVAKRTVAEHDHFIADPTLIVAREDETSRAGS